MIGTIRFHFNLNGYQAPNASLVLFSETKLTSLVTHWFVITSSLPCWLHCIHHNYCFPLHLQILKKNYIKTVDRYSSIKSFLLAGEQAFSCGVGGWREEERELEIMSHEFDFLRPKSGREMLIV